MKNSPPSPRKMTGKTRAFGLCAGAVAVSGLFCFFFFPWPLWLIIWFAMAAVAAGQLLLNPGPMKKPGVNTQGQEKDPPQSKAEGGPDPIEDFDNKIKWGRFR